jgi:formate dehydrogenase major subunit
MQPVAFCELHPDDLAEIGVEAGGQVTLSTRRGAITLAAKASTSMPPGNVFVPFHFREAAANVLTNDVLDPYGKIPEFKFCAVKVERA